MNFTNLQIPDEPDPFINGYFRILRFILGATGTWPFASTKHIRRLNILRGVLWILPTIYVCYGEFINLSYPDKDIFEKTEGVIVSTTAIIAIIKNFVFNYKKENLKLMFLLSKDLHINVPVEKNEEIKQISKRNKKTADITTKTLLPLIMSVLFFYAAFPIIRLWLHNIKVLPYPSKFPYLDEQNTVIFWTLHVIEVYVGAGVVFTFCADTLFAALIMNMCTSIHILKHSVEIATTETETFGKSSPLFINCVNYHRRILR